MPTTPKGVLEKGKNTLESFVDEGNGNAAEGKQLLRMDMCMDMCTDMCTDMCMDMCMDARMEICTDMYMAMHIFNVATTAAMP